MAPPERLANAVESWVMRIGLNSTTSTKLATIRAQLEARTYRIDLDRLACRIVDRDVRLHRDR